MRALPGETGVLHWVETEEIVRARYLVMAEDDEEVREKFNSGDITEPLVYEAQSAEIVSIELA